MRTLGRLWWHTILALMIAGAAALVGILAVEYGQHNAIESAGVLLFVAAVIVGAPAAFIALELRHHYQRKQARVMHTHTRTGQG